MENAEDPYARRKVQRTVFCFKENALIELVHRFRVEEWQYEFIDVDKLQESGGLEIEETNESLKFESIDVPYNPDPLERAHLRLRHGRLTMEHNGRLKTVYTNIFR